MNDYFGRVAEIFDELQEHPPPGLDEFVSDLLETWDRGGRVLSFGNGGSATDSLHFTTELVAKFRDQPLHRPALSLSGSPSTLTAVSNDWSFEEVFSRQVRAQSTDGDLLLGISTSGNSSNVLHGLRAGLDQGLTCYGLTGRDPGGMAELGIPLIQVPATRTAHVQEAHIACLHYVCDRIDRSLNSPE